MVKWFKKENVSSRQAGKKRAVEKNPPFEIRVKKIEE